MYLHLYTAVGCYTRHHCSLRYCLSPRTEAILHVSIYSKTAARALRDCVRSRACLYQDYAMVIARVFVTSRASQSALLSS